MRELFLFYGEDRAINWHVDSSVARSIAERQGVGALKHLQTRALWLQERVALDEILPVREPTLTNEADLNTKVHPQKRFEYLVHRLGMRTLGKHGIVETKAVGNIGATQLLDQVRSFMKLLDHVSSGNRVDFEGAQREHGIARCIREGRS